MNPAVRPSQKAMLLGAIPSQSATAVQVSPWILVRDYEWIVGVVNVGAITTGGTVNATFQQATNASGAGAKAVTGSSITALTAAGSNSNEEAWIEIKADQLDGAHGFTYVQMSITPSGAAALIAGEVYGFDPKQANPIAVDEPTSVAQIVSLPAI